MNKPSPRVHVVLLVAVIVGGVALCAPASARAGTRGHAGAGGDIGLGIVLIRPTGLTLEIEMGPTAIEIAAGLEDFDDDDNDQFYAHLTWKAYLADLTNGRGSVRLPIYLGIGGFGQEAGNDDFILGARAPLGLNIDFRSAPIHLFLEGALELALVDPADDIDLDLTGAVGFRFFF